MSNFTFLISKEVVKELSPRFNQHDFKKNAETCIQPCQTSIMKVFLQKDLTA